MSRDRWSEHPCEALSALVDGELPSGGRRAAVEAHLRSCPVCRALKEDIERLRQAVAAETPAPMPADLAARIRGRIDASTPARSSEWWRMPWRVPMPAAAAAAVVVVAIVWLAWPPLLVPPGAPTPSTEDAAPLRPGATEAPGAPPSMTSPAPAPESAPAPVMGQAATARENLESKVARSRSSSPPPSVARRDDTAPAPPLDAPARRDEASQFKDAVVPGVLDLPARQQTQAPPAALEAVPYLVRLLPDGSMVVRSREYRCVVPIAPEDARLLASLGERATAAGPNPIPAAPSFATPGKAAGAAEAAALAEPPPVVIPPTEGRSAILRLVRERYRAIIEERCGPLPR